MILEQQKRHILVQTTLTMQSLLILYQLVQQQQQRRSPGAYFSHYLDTQIISDGAVDPEIQTTHPKGRYLPRMLRQAQHKQSAQIQSTN